MQVLELKSSLNFLSDLIHSCIMFKSVSNSARTIKKNIFIIFFMFVFPGVLCCMQEDFSYDEIRTPTSPHSQAQQTKPDDTQIQQMAINTVAHMATNLINISGDPYNTQNVGMQVASLLGSFINFVAFAMRHPDLMKLLESSEFQAELRTLLITRMHKQHVKSSDYEFVENETISS